MNDQPSEYSTEAAYARLDETNPGWRARTPADDAGDELAWLREENGRLLAEAESSRNTWRKALDVTVAERDEARAEVDSLRVTLAAVAELLEDGSRSIVAEVENGFSRGVRCSDLRAILAADPVSLAGKCGTPGCDGDARYAAPGRGHSDTCTWPRNPEAVTSNG